MTSRRVSIKSSNPMITVYALPRGYSVLHVATGMELVSCRGKRCVRVVLDALANAVGTDTWQQLRVTAFAARAAFTVAA